jgi:hypothetical protein
MAITQQHRYLLPALLRESKRGTNINREQLAMALFTVTLGLSGVGALVLYEMGYQKSGFALSVSSGVIGSIVTAVTMLSD